MRLWSINPKYLDRAGLLAVWREGLLAKKVLAGKTKGYKNHPQLIRFINSGQPLKYINEYLLGIYQEAVNRGYNFKVNKLSQSARDLKIIKKNIRVSRSQLAYEFNHLLTKLKVRDNKRHQALKSLKKILPHSLFKVVRGKIEEWEKVK